MVLNFFNPVRNKKVMVISVLVIGVITGPLISIKTMENRVTEIYCEDKKRP